MGLSVREEAFVAHYIANGLRKGGAAARSAGYTAGSSRVRAHRLLKRPEIQDALSAEQERIRDARQFTVDRAVAMLFEAHRKASSATEEIAAIREIGKLLSLYAPKKKQTITAEVDLSRLEQLSDEELMKMAGIEM